MKSRKNLFNIISFFLLIIHPLVLFAHLTSPISFNGWYAGLSEGGAWGKSSYQTNPGCSPAGINGVFCAADLPQSLVNGSAVSNSGTGTLTPSSLIGGLDVGHNWQINHFVYGAEGDFSAFNLHQSVVASGLFPFSSSPSDSYTLSDSLSTNWLATVRGRVGVVIKNTPLLLYGTGGAAFTNYKASASYSDNIIVPGYPGDSGNGSYSKVIMGWSAGGGGEWLLTNHFSIRIEYLYTNFGSINFNLPISNTPEYTQTMKIKFNLTAQLVRFGINYRF